MIDSCRNELLLISSSADIAKWPSELLTALKNRANRGITVRALVDQPSSSSALSLAAAGVSLRPLHSLALPWSAARALTAEAWIFDRQETMVANEFHQPWQSLDGRIECLFGPELAHAVATYFDLRWESTSPAASFSARHKHLAFHSGRKQEDEFFALAGAAQRELLVCLPGGWIARKLEAFLLDLLGDGLAITIYANAKRDNAYSIRRLRRLASRGAGVKICGGHLASECALVDGEWLYLGSLPRSWSPWSPSPCPAFLVQSPSLHGEVVAMLESQVSVELLRAPGRLSLNGNVHPAVAPVSKSATL